MFQFSPSLQKVLQQIHSNFQVLPLEDMQMPVSPLLDDFDLTKSAIQDSLFEEFLMKCQFLVDADVKLFMELLES